MAITKKAAPTASKPAAKAPVKGAPAAVPSDVTLEPITVMRTFLEGGARNEDDNETLEHVAFPANAKVSKVAVMLGTSEDYGAVKASVTVSVPCLLDEVDNAAAFATEKAKEYLDAIADMTGVEDEPVKGKREVSSSRKAGGKSKVEEPEEEEEEEVAEDGEDVQLFTEEELHDMDEDDLKSLCETWEIAWPKSKKASVAKAGAISAILEKQSEYEEAEGEDGEEAEGEDAEGEDDGIGPEDIEAMDRKQIEEFIAEYNEDCEDGEELDVDMTEYPKNAKGLAKIRKDLIGALFTEE